MTFVDWSLLNRTAYVIRHWFLLSRMKNNSSMHRSSASDLYQDEAVAPQREFDCNGLLLEKLASLGRQSLPVTFVSCLVCRKHRQQPRQFSLNNISHSVDLSTKAFKYVDGRY